MPTIILHPPQRDRLVKLCGLLGSDHAGERDSAAVMASRLLRECGLTWADVILPQLELADAAGSNRAAPPTTGGHAAAARWVLARQVMLNRWERSFIEGIQDRPTLTPRQAATLAGIIDRLRDAPPSRQAGGR